MARKRRGSGSKSRTSKRAAQARAIPKWKREHFSSYRQYLNARYVALGFKSYSDYSAKRERGEVPSTRGLPKSKPGGPIAAPIVAERQLPDVKGLTRISYDVYLPFRYTLAQRMGAQIVAFLRAFIAEIEKKHSPSEIYSGAWRIFGQSAMDLDEDGAPIWDAKEWEEWSSHMDWSKTVDELLSTARAYGDHEFLEYGRQIGRGTSRVYALLITHVRLSVVLIEGIKHTGGTK